MELSIMFLERKLKHTFVPSHWKGFLCFSLFNISYFLGSFWMQNLIFWLINIAMQKKFTGFIWLAIPIEELETNTLKCEFFHRGQFSFFPIWQVYINHWASEGLSIDLFHAYLINSHFHLSGKVFRMWRIFFWSCPSTFKKNDFIII